MLLDFFETENTHARMLLSESFPESLIALNLMKSYTGLRVLREPVLTLCAGAPWPRAWRRAGRVTGRGGALTAFSAPRAEANL